MNARSGRRKSKGIIFVFLAPAVLLYGFFFLYPAVRALRLSLYRWEGLKFVDAEFIGLGNFVKAFGDKWVWTAIKNNLLIMTLGGVLMFSFSLLFAVALTNKRFRGKGFFRAVIFYPYMISGVGVGLFWNFVLNSRIGLLNGTLEAVGLGSLAQNWLGQPRLAMGWIIYVVVWWGIGFYMLFLVAGIRTIPGALFDAAQIDGASGLQIFLHVTLPLLREYLAIAAVLWIVEALRTFGVVLLLTGGGPANRTHVLTTYMSKVAFNTPAGSAGAVFRLGYGTTIAVILMVLVVLGSLVYFRLSRAEALEF